MSTDRAIDYLRRAKANISQERVRRQAKEGPQAQHYADRYRRGFADALLWAESVIDHEIRFREGKLDAEASVEDQREELDDATN